MEYSSRSPSRSSRRPPSRTRSRRERAAGAAATTLPVATSDPKVNAAKASASPGKLDVTAATAKLGDPATAAEGLAMVTNAGAAGKVLAPRIEGMLRAGLPPSLAVDAIKALEGMGPLATPALIAPYVQHRDAGVRWAAAGALSHTRSPEGAAALRKGLRSSDAKLRALCASGLGAAGDKESVPDLVKALDRGISEAAPSIAALCVGPSCDDLVARLDKLPAVTAKATFETMVRRKPALGDDLLIAAVEKVKPIVGASAKAYFSSLAKGFKGSKKVQKALDAAARPAKGARP